MFDWLNVIPAFIRILIIFTLILLIIKRKWTLGNAFLTGSAGLGLIFGMQPLPIIQSAVAAMVHPKTLSLSIVVSLILVLSHSMEESGQMERLLEGFKGLVRWPKVNIVIFPALIGLLPMPGGAIFSAPMVKNLGDDYGLSGSQLSYINYWFRHIWEYWWPLYPGILLTTALAEVDLWHLVIFTLPLTLVAVAVGYWPLRGTIVGSQRVVMRHTMGPFFFDSLFGTIPSDTAFSYAGSGQRLCGRTCVTPAPVSVAFQRVFSDLTDIGLPAYAPPYRVVVAGRESLF